MTDATEPPTLDDVMETSERAVPDIHEHAKAPPRPDDEALATRTDEEREAVDIKEAGSTGLPAAE
ncbi:MAG TPA: hypothetical protein VHV57_16020 [Acidimicrobiales bacterium]|jgi:hypothetical protein|nr:hypothetical protein [Acidimicrobiales bacterium]